MRLRSHWQGVTEHLYRSRSDSDSRILFIDQLSAKTKEVRRVRTWRNEERMGAFLVSLVAGIVLVIIKLS